MASTLNVFYTAEGDFLSRHSLGEVDIDICSCKEFSQEDAIAFAKHIFQTDDVEAHFVVRGNRSLRPETPDPVRYAEAVAARQSRLAVR